MSKQHEDSGPAQKLWDSCGYLTLSKKGNVLSIVIKHKRYVVNLKQAAHVINDEIDYALIYEFVPHANRGTKPLPTRGFVGSKSQGQEE